MGKDTNGTINLDVRDLMRADAVELYEEAKRRAMEATKGVRIQCVHCGKRNEVDVPDSRELRELTALAAAHGFGRPHEAARKPQAPPGGFTTAALEALSTEELKALL